MASIESYKKQAAVAAVELVHSGMVLGLGHGSTFQYVLEPLAARLRNGELRNLNAIPCSRHTEAEMLRLGIPLGDLNAFPSLDMTIDGADEVDPQYNLIKGGGGALLREKIVAQSSSRNVIIIDESKLSGALGTNHSLPLELIPFGWERQRDFIAELGGNPRLRVDINGKPVFSDQGNYLLDCETGPITDLKMLAGKLESRSGILEHGLFLGLATDVIVAGPSGLHRFQAKP